MTKRRDIHQAIMIAAAKGIGLRLTAEEAWDLSTETAVADAAFHVLSPADQELCEKSNHVTFWKRRKA